MDTGALEAIEYHRAELSLPEQRIASALGAIGLLTDEEAEALRRSVARARWNWR